MASYVVELYTDELWNAVHWTENKREAVEHAESESRTNESCTLARVVVPAEYVGGSLGWTQEINIIEFPAPHPPCSVVLIGETIQLLVLVADAPLTVNGSLTITNSHLSSSGIHLLGQEAALNVAEDSTVDADPVGLELGPGESEDMRRWASDQVDEVTRREVLSGGTAVDANADRIISDIRAQLARSTDMAGTSSGAIDAEDVTQLDNLLARLETLRMADTADEAATPVAQDMVRQLRNVRIRDEELAPVGEE